jgi:heme/copper-type cytochrome/quinol oxidase subunit 1
MFNNIVSVLAVMGFGGAIVTYLRIMFERHNQAQLEKQKYMEVRYKCIIILAYVALDFEKRNRGLEHFGRQFISNDDVLDELRTEWHNAILYASDELLESLHGFIRKPSVACFKRTALAMRKDLWGGKISNQLSRLEF